MNELLNTDLVKLEEKLSDLRKHYVRQGVGVAAELLTADFEKYRHQPQSADQQHYNTGYATAMKHCIDLLNLNTVPEKPVDIKRT